MSLKPDARSSRARSRSRTGDRSRSRSNVRVPSPPETVVAAPRYTSAVQYLTAASGISMPSMPGGFDDSPPPSSYHDIRSPAAEYGHRSGYPSTSTSHGGGLPYPSTNTFPGHDSLYSPIEDHGITTGSYTNLPPHERPGYARQRSDHITSPLDDDLAYGATPFPDYQHQKSGGFGQAHSPYPNDNYSGGAQYPPRPTSSHSQAPQYQGGRHSSYANQQPYQYAQPPDKISYTAKPQSSHTSSYPQSTQRPSLSQTKRTVSGSDHANVVEVTPSGRHSSSASLNPGGLMSGMSMLSVSGHHPGNGAGNLPPPSPLLEAYRGTYQSVSPMVAPLALHNDSDLSDLEPLSSETSSTKKHKHSSSKHEKRSSHSSKSSRHDSKDKNKEPDKHSEKQRDKEKKHVKLYDGEEDARALADALSHSKINTETVCEILPALSHDQMLELRSEYKKYAKVQGRGINIAKHLKMKLTGNFGKVAYVCALGRWESEGYWANFWYQAHGSRRELLIESLMGRSNADIRQIKDTFKDKRYGDDLKRCMEKELKADKFRTAVMMVLEERRQEETDIYPTEYRNQDVSILNRCMRAKEGGESAMLEIIVKRSDAHLREVLQTYERMHGSNFARDALRKSNNLVGEVIAHILNGVINRPARDALLLRHAINDIASHNKEDDLRYELLISRLVRFHWDRVHMLRVKREYYEKNGRRLEQDIEDATKGDFRDFMLELCEGGRA